MVRTAIFDGTETVFTNRIADSRVDAVKKVEVIGKIVEADHRMVRAFLEGWNGIYKHMTIMSKNSKGGNNMAQIYLIEG